MIGSALGPVIELVNSIIAASGHAPELNVNTCTVDDLYYAVTYGKGFVSNNRIITDATLKSWEIDRVSMTRILKGVIDHRDQKHICKFSITDVEYYQTVYESKVPKYNSRGEPMYEEDGTPTYITYKVYENHISDGDSHDVMVDAMPDEIREQHTLDWQIVYLLCLYNAIDNLDSLDISSDSETGEVVISKLSEQFINSVIEDVAPRIDYAFNPVTYWTNKNIFTGKVSLSTYDVASLNDKFYSKVYVGYNPSHIENYVEGSGECWYCVPRVVYNYIDTIIYRDTAYAKGGTVRWERTYNTKRLKAAIEKYGNGRDIVMFLYALDEMPQGRKIADSIRYAISQEEKLIP